MARKVKNTNTKCCIYESSESYTKYIDSNTKKPIYLWYREYDKNYDGDFTGRYLCNKCWNKESPNSFDNIQKSLCNRRVNNLNQNSYSAKGDKYQLLVCKQFGWEDLNKKYDNYNTPIDCYDSTQVLGDNSLELACELYEWIDLNKKNNNYSTGTPIDCYNQKTGLYHQVQGQHYNTEYEK